MEVSWRRLLLQLSWKVANMVAVVGLVILTAQWANSFPRPVESISGVVAACVFYASVLLMLGCLLYCTNRLFRSRVFIILGFSALFVWGCASYFCWPVDREEDEKVEPSAVLQLESANRLCACFFSGTCMETVPASGSRLNYELFHCALIFFLGAWAFSLWGRGCMNRLRRHGVLDRHLNVFWATNEQSLVLARDIICNSAVKQVQFNISSDALDEGDAAVRSLDGLDCLWLPVDFDRIRATHAHGASHYFLSDSTAENVRLANAVIQSMPPPDGAEKKTFHVRIESSADEQSYYDWAESVKDRVDIAIVRESEMIARQLMADYPVLEQCPGVSHDKTTALASGDVRLLLIGLGSVGWDVLERMISETRFSVSGGKELPFSCTVIDRKAGAWRAYREYCPEAVSSYHVVFKQIDVDSMAFSDWLRQHLGKYNRVVLCLPGDEMNISVLCLMERISKGSLLVRQDAWAGGEGKPRIFVKVRDSDRHAVMSDVQVGKATAGDTFYSRVRFFGDLERLYVEKFLNFDVLYEIAAVLNACHEEKRWLSWDTDRRLIEQHWAQATFESRRSSLSSAAGELNALRLMGFRHELPKLAQGRECDISGKIEMLLDTLARNEHYRWNAWHRTNGYCRWDMDNPPIEGESDKKANKLREFRRHAAIVDYDDLPLVDVRIARASTSDPTMAEKISAEDFKDDKNGLQKWDREFCREMQQNLARAGYSIVQA